MIKDFALKRTREALKKEKEKGNKNRLGMPRISRFLPRMSKIKPGEVVSVVANIMRADPPPPPPKPKSPKLQTRHTLTTMAALHHQPIPPKRPTTPPAREETTEMRAMHVSGIKEPPKSETEPEEEVSFQILIVLARRRGRRARRARRGGGRRIHPQ